jgi:hypothetical protein
MPPKKGNLLPKKGNVLHRVDRDGEPNIDYASAIAAALHHELGMTHQAIKLAMRWTGASERTVKYWFAGTGGPSGEHLIALARHSDAILEVLLRRAGRSNYATALRIIDAHQKLEEALRIIRVIVDNDVRRA